MSTFRFDLQPGDTARIIGTEHTGIIVSRTSAHAQFRYDANGRVRNITISSLEGIVR